MYKYRIEYTSKWGCSWACSWEHTKVFTKAEFLDVVADALIASYHADPSRLSHVSPEPEDFVSFQELIGTGDFHNEMQSRGFSREYTVDISLCDLDEGAHPNDGDCLLDDPYASFAERLVAAFAKESSS